MSPRHHYRADPGNQDFVRHVAAVPGHEIVHLVNGRSCQMKGVVKRLPWQPHLPKEAPRQLKTLRSQNQPGELLHYSQTAPGGFRISRTDFPQNSSGNIELEVRPGLPPPELGRPLMGRSNRIAACPSSQIADDTGLQIDLGPQNPSSRDPSELLFSVDGTIYGSTVPSMPAAGSSASSPKATPIPRAAASSPCSPGPRRWRSRGRRGR